MSVYSHPVLRNDTNDVKGELIFKRPIIGINKLSIKNSKLDNKELEQLIDYKSLLYMLQIENQTSYFSRIYKSHTLEFKIFLDPSKFPEGRYSLELLVVANKNITDYHLNSFHEDFNGTKFEISNGDIIAYFGAYKFELNKNFGSLNEPESFFEWEDTDDDSLKGRSLVYPMGDKIKIQVHTDDKTDILHLMQGISVDYLTLAYIVPALTYVLKLLIDDIIKSESKGEPMQYENDGWAITIFDLCDQYEIQLPDDNPVYTAHVLARDPIISSSTHLMELATGGFTLNEN